MDSCGTSTRISPCLFTATMISPCPLRYPWREWPKSASTLQNATKREPLPYFLGYTTPSLHTCSYNFPSPQYPHSSVNIDHNFNNYILCNPLHHTDKPMPSRMQWDVLVLSNEHRQLRRTNDKNHMIFNQFIWRLYPLKRLDSFHWLWLQKVHER